MSAPEVQPEGRPLPKVEYTSIEYPGAICNVPKALSTMGGIESISKVTSCCTVCNLQCLQAQDKFLELNFRPGCPYSHPLFANRISTSNFLLTVKRKSPTSSDFDFEIAGLIPQTYAFRGLFSSFFSHL
jgi:general transcription factor 3C polypeptide 5 (transcription factor C subunit 1)